MTSRKTPVIYFCFSLVLRSLLIAASAISVVSMLTSRQTKDFYDPNSSYDQYQSYSFKFSQSPSFIYFVAAISIAGVYGTITKLSSCLFICVAPTSSGMLVFFAFFDVLILGLIASGTGSAGSVAYILLKGNNNLGWSEFCSLYNTFCVHLGISFGFSLFACILLIFLLWTSLFTLYSRISKQIDHQYPTTHHPSPALT